MCGNGKYSRFFFLVVTNHFQGTCCNNMMATPDTFRKEKHASSKMSYSTWQAEEHVLRSRK